MSDRWCSSTSAPSSLMPRVQSPVGCGIVPCALSSGHLRAMRPSVCLMCRKSTGGRRVFTKLRFRQTTTQRLDRAPPGHSQSSEGTGIFVGRHAASPPVEPFKCGRHAKTWPPPPTDYFIQFGTESFEPEKTWRSPPTTRSCLRASVARSRCIRSQAASSKRIWEGHCAGKSRRWQGFRPTVTGCGPPAATPP